MAGGIGIVQEWSRPKAGATQIRHRKFWFLREATSAISWWSSTNHNPSQNNSPNIFLLGPPLSLNPSFQSPTNADSSNEFRSATSVLHSKILTLYVLSSSPPPRRRFGCLLMASMSEYQGWPHFIPRSMPSFLSLGSDKVVSAGPWSFLPPKAVGRVMNLALEILQPKVGGASNGSCWTWLSHAWLWKGGVSWGAMARLRDEDDAWSWSMLLSDSYDSFMLTIDLALSVHMHVLGLGLHATKVATSHLLTTTLFVFVCHKQNCQLKISNLESKISWLKNTFQQQIIFMYI